LPEIKFQNGKSNLKNKDSKKISGRLSQYKDSYKLLLEQVEGEPPPGRLPKGESSALGGVEKV
tara:strand:- start:244 stop:432 length:189 start_codon:yes stop_codon:yes gene_type:complete